MADLYGTPPSSNAALPSESEEISTFLNHLLYNNSSTFSSASSSSSSCMTFRTKYMHSFSSPTPPAPPLPEATSADRLVAQPEDRHLLGRSANRHDSNGRFGDGNSAAGSSAVVDSSSGVNFSDPEGFFGADVKESTENAFSSVGVLDSDANTSSKRRGILAENDIGDLSCDSEGPEASDVVPLNPLPPRTSSKRGRAAEVHNLSEKRRRSRINEKMKALQNLIPNSNKTDKASMLDEAIEYLKQLQLQVQMLSMRNGLSLHPMCLPEALQPMQLPQTGMSFDEGNGLVNSNRGTGTFSASEESSVQTAFNFSNQCTISNQQHIVIPPVTNISASEPSFGFEPLIQAHYGPFNMISSSSKEICSEGTPQLQLDSNHSLKNSSSGVS